MPRRSNTIILRPDGRYEARGMFGDEGEAAVAEEANDAANS